MKNGRESFSAYLDKSEESSIDVYVVGGFVGKAEVWEELTTKWLDCFADWDYVLPCNRLLHRKQRFEGLDRYLYRDRRMC